MSWALQRISKNVHRINFDAEASSDWEQWVLLTGDRHYDSPHSLRKLQRRHLNMAQERDAPVIDIGDFFDLMQGKHDPRQEKKTLLAAQLRWMKDNPDLDTEEFAYHDYIVDDAAAFFEPYKDQFAVIGYGNHETKIMKHEETDILKRFAARIGREDVVGGYGGWVLMTFSVNGTEKHTVPLKYYHGSGGGGPVTKGVIQTNRRAVFLPDAKIVVTGHIHESWQVSITRERINTHGNIRIDEQLHICVPTYKEEYNDGHLGWHVETGKPPKPVGAVWLRFAYRQKGGKKRKRAIEYEAIRAK